MLPTRARPCLSRSADSLGFSGSSPQHPGWQVDPKRPRSSTALRKLWNCFTSSHRLLTSRTTERAVKTSRQRREHQSDLISTPRRASRLGTLLHPQRLRKSSTRQSIGSTPLPQEPSVSAMLRRIPPQAPRRPNLIHRVLI